MLRSEPSIPAARAVSAGVAASLASEPVVMRPVRRQMPRRSSPINRSAAGLAIAASLVALAVMVGPGLMTGSGFGPNRSGFEPDVASSPVAQTDRAVAQGRAATTEPMVERWAMDEPESSTALDALLVDHRERASASGLTGFIPYAAVVGPSGVR
jgi:hypothetical protein